MGGLLQIVAFGAGRFALDRGLRNLPKPSTEALIAAE
jgi:hypothetical protein